MRGVHRGSGLLRFLVYLLGDPRSRWTWRSTRWWGTSPESSATEQKERALKIYSCVEAAHLAVKLLSKVGADGKAVSSAWSSQESIDFRCHADEGKEWARRKRQSFRSWLGKTTYTAIDFETANSYPGGGASVVPFDLTRDGQKLEEFYTLLRPKHSYFDPGDDGGSQS